MLGTSAAGCLPDHTRRASGQSPHLLPYLACSICAPPSAVPSADAETFLVEDQATGQVLELSRQEYVLGAVAAEMPVSWPDEALKAQAVAAHSYALYCRDHTTLQSGAWLTADPARRQGCPDRAGAAQLLGHRLRAELRPPLRPCGRGLG